MSATETPADVSAILSKLRNESKPKPDPEPEPEIELSTPVAPEVPKAELETADVNADADAAVAVVESYIDAETELIDFSNLADEILKEWRVNRVNEQSVIDHCMEKLLAGNANRFELETLAKALGVKSDSTTNIVKLMEARSKLIGALKPAASTRLAAVVNQSDNGGGEHQLAALLEQTQSEDEP